MVTVGTITGFGFFVWGIAEDGRVDRTDLRSVGVLLVLLGAVYLVARWLDRRESQPASAPLDYETIYRHGWQDRDGLDVSTAGNLATVLRLVMPDAAVSEIEPEPLAGAGSE